MPTLAEELLLLQGEMVKDLPADVLHTIAKLTKERIASGLAEKSLSIGDQFPDFQLNGLLEDEVRLDDLLKKGTLVVNFYHGEWCPFCNNEINAYQQVMPKIRKLGAQFIAISSQLPNHAFPNRDKRKLAFDVLFDKGNRLSRKLGILFDLKGPLKEIYNELGYVVPDADNNASWQLPVSATYIVKSNREIAQCFIDADYIHRMDPVQVVRFLEIMKEESQKK